MSRLSIFVIFFMTLITVALSATSLNTPSNQLQGSKVTITWKYDGPSGETGTLSLINKNDPNKITALGQNVKLSSQSFPWVVDAEPGTYYLSLSNPDGNAESGNFNIVTPSNTSSTTSGSTQSSDSSSPSNTS
ncbi:11336_t:CDS:2, partial [Ambispora gerdemannii]